MTVQEAEKTLASIVAHLKTLYGTSTIPMTSPAVTVEDVEASIVTLSGH